MSKDWQCGAQARTFFDRLCAICMYRSGWLPPSSLLSHEILQAQPPEVDMLVQLLRPAQHAAALPACCRRTARRGSHDGLEHVYRIGDVGGHAGRLAPAQPAIGHARRQRQARGRGAGRDEGRQRRGARVEARPDGLGRGGIAATGSWRARVAARRGRARGRRVRREPIQAPHGDAAGGASRGGRRQRRRRRAREGGHSRRRSRRPAASIHLAREAGRRLG